MDAGKLFFTLLFFGIMNGSLLAMQSAPSQSDGEAQRIEAIVNDSTRDPFDHEGYDWGPGGFTFFCSTPQSINIKKAFGEIADAFVDAVARNNMEGVQKNYPLLTQQGKRRRWLISAAATVAASRSSCLDSYMFLLGLKEFVMRPVHLVRAVGTMVELIGNKRNGSTTMTIPEIVEKYRPVLKFICQNLEARNQLYLAGRNAHELDFVRRQLSGLSDPRYGTEEELQACGFASSYLWWLMDA